MEKDINQFIREEAEEEIKELNKKIDKRGGKPTAKQAQEHLSLLKILKNQPRKLKVKLAHV